MADYSRREFLKWSGTAFAAALFFSVPPDDTKRARSDQPSAVGLGRVTTAGIWAYNDPRPGSKQLKYLPRDTVLDLYGSTSGVGFMPHNSIWNLSSFGWVYSSWVQPVQQQFNTVIRNLPDGGLWGQVTIPYAEMRVKPDDKAYRQYRIYYSSVFQVIAHVLDRAGQSWYQLRDDIAPGSPQYVRAEGLRILSEEEFSPISPDVEDKRLEVNLEEQMLYAYENGSPVFSARCATGDSFNVEGQGVVDFRTPRGKHMVIRKSPSQHMIGGAGREDHYDLPGVPFCTYFTASGVAVHGAYWHNDFGHVRSHGCVNVLAQDAQWVYRWSMPFASYDEALLRADKDGTQVTVS